MVAVAQNDWGTVDVRLRELRGERTLAEVARASGIRQDELSKIERGMTRSVRFETLLRLCEALDASIGDLFAVDPIEPSPRIDMTYPDVPVVVDQPLPRRRFELNKEDQAMVDVTVRGLSQATVALYDAEARRLGTTRNAIMAIRMRTFAPRPPRTEKVVVDWEALAEATKDLSNPEVMAGAWS